MLCSESAFESAPIIVNWQRGQHDTQRDRAVRRRSDDSASHNSNTGQNKKNRRERLPFVYPATRSRRFFLFCPVLELWEALSSLLLRTARSRWVSCWPRCQFTIIGADSNADSEHSILPVGLPGV